MISFIQALSLLRGFYISKFNSKVSCKKLSVHPSAKIIIEQNSTLVLGQSAILKKNSCIYVRSNSSLSIGCHLSLGTSSEISIGSGCHISLGSYLLVASNVLITNVSHGTSLKKPFALQDMISGPLEIGKNVWIGRGSSILAKSNIGNNSIVGCNSVTNKSYDPQCLIAGCPAKQIKKLAE